MAISPFESLAKTAKEYVVELESPLTPEVSVLAVQSITKVPFACAVAAVVMLLLVE